MENWKKIDPDMSGLEGLSKYDIGSSVSKGESAVMDNKEAIRAMLEGKKVRRIDWGIDTWLTYDENEIWFVDETCFRDDLNDYLIDEHWEIEE